MATNELVSKLNELTELRRMAEDISAEIEAIQNEIKAHMTESDTDTITAGAFKVTWKAVISTRIDTTALRKDLPEIWHEYARLPPPAASMSQLQNKSRSNYHITPANAAQ